MTTINVDQKRIDQVTSMIQELDQYMNPLEDDNPTLIFDRYGHRIVDDKFYTVDTTVDEYFSLKDDENFIENVAKFVTRTPSNRCISAEYYVLHDGRKEYTFYVMLAHDNQLWADLVSRKDTCWYLANGEYPEVVLSGAVDE